MTRCSISCVLALAGLALATPAIPQAHAQGIELSGSIAGELRVFPDDAQFSDQDDRHFEPSVTLNPEFRYELEDGTRFTVIPFYRYDAADWEERTHFDLREANVYIEGDDWDVTAGLGKVFWGVAESRHLVDVVNQTDLVEDIDGEEKLGQPMVQLNLLRDWGTVGMFVLPGFRERTFVDPDNRLRGGTPVDPGAAQFESELGRAHVDLAARYSHFIGNWDFAVSHFWGTSRDPRFEEFTRADGREMLAPVYDIIHQTGLELQYTTDTTLWKFEGIRHGGFRTSDDFLAMVGGFEYTLFGVAETPVDLGLLAEYLWDDRDAGAAGTLQENDVFLGSRLALNDVEATEALVGVSTDTKNGEMFFLAEAERRIGDDMKVELEARFFFDVESDSAAAGTREDSHATIRWSWFF